MADTYEIVQPNANGPHGPFFLGDKVELESVPSYLVGKVRKIEKEPDRELEIATPSPKPKNGDPEAELRTFIYEKSGNHAASSAKLSTLKRQAKKLGWGE